MAEVGEEMSQAEVAHHANRSPEYLCSRTSKQVCFYKKALALCTTQIGEPRAGSTTAAGSSRTGHRRRESEAHDTARTEASGTNPSDLDVYERRVLYSFPEGTTVTKELPTAEP